MIFPDNNNPIRIYQKTITKTLLIIVAVLFAASCVGAFFRYGMGHPQVYGFVPLFDLDAEENIPTYFSSCILLLASALLFLIAIAKKRINDRFTWHWFCLAFIFLYLSIDESASLHELTIEPVRNLTGAGSVLYFAWVIPAMIGLVILAICYFRFLFSLPPKTRNLFFLAAVLYVGGAIGLELPEGYWAEKTGGDDFVYWIFVSIEEPLEMLGVVCFIHALLGYLASVAPRQEFFLHDRGYSSMKSPSA